jgi:hypothetical protein
MRFKLKWVLAIVLAVGLADAWWEYSRSPDDDGDAAVIDALANEPIKARARQTVQPVSTASVSTTPAPANWKTGVNDVFSSGGTTAEQAKSLLAQFPNLPPAGQYEVAHHICNLLPDDAYGPWAGYLTNAATAPEVLTVIYADLMQRPNSLKLPLLLQLARTPSHPRSGDAAQLLRNTLGADYGSDWATWRVRLQAWLQAHPDPRPGFSGMTVGN